MQLRALMAALAAIVALSISGVTSVAHATVEPERSAAAGAITAKAKADTFWCVAGGSYNVVNRTTYGDGWVQLVGQKANGNRAIFVSHPTGRNDTYRIRIRPDDGRPDLVLGPETQSNICTSIASGERIRTEARRAGTGGDFSFGDWRRA